MIAQPVLSRLEELTKGLARFDANGKLSVNAPVDYEGDLIDYQVDDEKKFKVDSAGRCDTIVLYSGVDYTTFSTYAREMVGTDDMLSGIPFTTPFSGGYGGKLLVAESGVNQQCVGIAYDGLSDNSSPGELANCCAVGYLNQAGSTASGFGGWNVTMYTHGPKNLNQSWCFSSYFQHDGDGNIGFWKGYSAYRNYVGVTGSVTKNASYWSGNQGGVAAENYCAYYEDQGEGAGDYVIRSFGGKSRFSGDIIVDRDDRGFVAKSSDGKYWRLGVGNDGVVTSTLLPSLMDGLIHLWKLGEAANTTRVDSFVPDMTEGLIHLWKLDELSNISRMDNII